MDRLGFMFAPDVDLDRDGGNIQTDRIFDIDCDLLVRKFLQDAGPGF